MRIKPELMEASQWRVDGDFWLQYYCTRCGDRFYVHALSHLGMCDAAPDLCGVCRGDRTASQESHRNAVIEAKG